MIVRKEENRLMAQVVQYGAFIETAGQVASDISAGIEGQTRQALESIDRLLAQIDASKEHLTRVQIWLANMNDYEAMNAVYAEWLKECGKPVRACVGSNLVSGGYLVEIQAFAYKEN